MDDDEVTEITDMFTSRMAAVDRPANQTPWLILKAEADPVVKADKVNCPTCEGDGKIKSGSTDCPDCDASGKVGKQKAANMAKAEGDDIPGSSGWEAQDAANLRQIATLAASLKTQVESAAARERVELDAGAEDSYSDAWCLEDAASLLDAALGIVAAMAFKEQQESTDAAVSEATGLLTKAEAEIHSVQERLAGKTGADVATSEEVPMEKSELEEVLAARDEALIEKITKAQADAVDERITAWAGLAEQQAATTTKPEGQTGADDMVTVTKAEWDAAVVALGGTPTATTEGDSKPTEPVVKADGSDDLPEAVKAALAERDEQFTMLKSQVEEFGAKPREGGPAMSDLAGQALQRGGGTGKSASDDLFERFLKAEDPDEKARLGEELTRTRFVEAGVVTEGESARPQSFRPDGRPLGSI